MFKNRSVRSQVTTFAVIAAVLTTLSLQLVLALVGINGNVFAATNQAAVVSVPMAMNFQGILRDAQGKPLANGDYSMTFRLYSTLTATSALWTEKQTTVAVKDGRFSTTLGSVTPLLSSYFASSNRFVGVQVGTQQEMQPRQRLGAVPFAVNADLLDGQDATFYSPANHKHSAADITSGQLPDNRVANNLTIDGGKITNSPIDNSAIGQTTPKAGTFTSVVADSLRANNLTFQSLGTTSTISGTTKPIVFRWYVTTGPRSGSADGSTGMRVADYVCGISGYTTDTADIYEGYSYGETLLRVRAYAHSDGFWHYSAQIHTQNADGNEEPQWQVGVMCVHRSMAFADDGSQYVP